MSSIKEVAKKAGVSISTVSNVLNRTKYVSPELTARVMEAVNALDYQANPIAQNMKSARTHTVGIISTDITGVFYPYVIKGLYNEFYKHGYAVQMFETEAMTDPLHSWDRMIEGIRRFSDYRVDGIVLTSIFPASIEEYYVNKILKIVNGEKKISLVSLETDFTRYGIDSIFCNSFLGAKCAVNHLIGKGCKKIAHITGPIFTRVSLDRLAGYNAALEEAGLECDERLIANGDYLHQSGYNGMKEILRSGADFDGLFVANDQMAIGAVFALHEAGKRIPQDVKVIGYDDVFISSVVDPPLTTIHVPKRSMGERGANLLISRMEGKLNRKEAVKLDLETKLIERQSTDINAHDDWIKNEW